MARKEETHPAPTGEPVPLPAPYRPVRITDRGAAVLLGLTVALLAGVALGGLTGPRSTPAPVTQTVVVEAPTAAPATQAPVVRPPVARQTAPKATRAPQAPRPRTARQTAVQPVAVQAPARRVAWCSTESNVKANGHASYARVDHYTDGGETRTPLTAAQYNATHC